MIINVERAAATLFVAVFGCLGVVNFAAALLFPEESLNTSTHLFTTLPWIWYFSWSFLTSLCIVSEFSLGGMFAPYFFGWCSSAYESPVPANMPYRVNFVCCCLRDAFFLFGVCSFARMLLRMSGVGLGLFLSHISDIAFALWVTILGILLAALFHAFQRGRIRKRIAQMETSDPVFWKWSVAHLPKGILGERRL
jgi:hypothetical protein